MFKAITTAANAMSAQSQRLEALAQSVASMGATPPAGGTQGNPDNPDAPVHIGALPVANPIETIVTLKEVELAYRMNAAVIGTAIKMIDSLLEIAGPRKDDRQVG